MPLETNLESVAAMLWLVWLCELVVVTFILHCVLYRHCLVTPLFTRDHDTPIGRQSLNSKSADISTKSSRQS